MSQTINELLLRQTRVRGDAPALRTRTHGTWATRSWADWRDTALAVAAALADLGVREGDRVGLLAGNRREWAEVFMGIAHAGAAVVALHPEHSAAQLGAVLEHAGCEVVFVEDALQAEKLFAPQAAALGEHVRRVVYFDAWSRLERPDERGRLEVRMEDAVPRAQRSRLMALGELLTAGRALLQRDAAAVHARAERVSPSDLAALVYPEHTRGELRVVPLSHGNFAWECEGLEDQLGLGAVDEQLLAQPLARLFAQVLLVTAVRAGCCTALLRSPRTALDDAGQLEPTFLVAEPRFFEDVKAAVEQRVGRESLVRRRAMQAALRVGLAYGDAVSAGTTPGPVLRVQHRAAELTVLESVRHSLGRRLRFALSGGEALSLEVTRWLHGCGVLVLASYGLAESTAVTHVNRPARYRLDSSGLPVPGVETRIAPDGELLVRGGNVTTGYFREAAVSPLDAQGWLHTGALGRVDAQGFLYVTGRKA